MDKVSYTSSFKKILLHALTFLPGILVIAWISSSADRALRTTGSWLVDEWNDVFSEGEPYDIVVLGNSRAWVHLDPKIFDSITGWDTYNFGIDGYPIDMQLVRFWALANDNRLPKLIIQNIDPFTLRKSGNVEWDKTQFLPYLYEPELRKVLLDNQLSWKEHYLPLFKYRGQREILRREIGQLMGEPVQEAAKYKGFAGFHVSWLPDFENFKKSNTEVALSLDEDMIGELRKMIAYSKEHNIQVVLAFLPMYDEATAMIKHKPELDSLMQSLSIEFAPNCHYLDYSRTSFSGDTAYFYNATHMNHKGADSISRIIATRIKEEIIQ